MTDAVNPTPAPSDKEIEKLRLDIEKYKTWLNYKQAIIGIIFASGIAVAIPVLAQVWSKHLDTELSQLRMEVERQKSDRENVAKWVDTFINQKIELRLRLAEYFSAVSNNEVERQRFESYHGTLLTRRNQVRVELEKLQRQQSEMGRESGGQESIEYKILAQRIGWLSDEIDHIPTIGSVEGRVVEERVTVVNATRYAGQRFLQDLLGRPRNSYTASECADAENEPMKSLLASGSVGPFSVTLIKPAHDSLKTVFDEVMLERPDYFHRIGTAGGFCARLVRGSSSAISQHAWGVAIDLTVDGRVHPTGKSLSPNDPTTAVYIFVAQKMIEHGWYWDGSNSLPNPMGFSVGQALLIQWAREEKLGDAAKAYVERLNTETTEP